MLLAVHFEQVKHYSAILTAIETQHYFAGLKPRESLIEHLKRCINGIEQLL